MPTPLVLDTTGEKNQHLCDHALLLTAYNWRSGGMNFERCIRKRGHRGVHEAHVTVGYGDNMGVLARVQWTDKQQLPEWGTSTRDDIFGIKRFWREVDKEGDR
jgi:hypothetical protein